jgi:hypothetical protein
MKKLSFIIALILSTKLLAQNNCCPKLPDCDAKPYPCCDFLAECINCHLPSGSPTRGFNFQLFFSQPSQDGMEYAINNSQAVGSNGSFSQLDFDWFVGVRGGIEYIYHYDHWNLSLNGSILKSHAKDWQKREVVNQTDFLEDFNNIGLFPTWNHPSSYAGYMKKIRYERGHAKWEEDFYTLNLMLSKKFCLSKKITFRPAFGLNSLFIFDTYKISYDNGKTFPIDISDTLLTPLHSSSKNDQDTFGIGPRVGVETRWYFCPNVNFHAGTFGSLLYTYFYTTRHDLNKFTIDQDKITDNIKLKYDFTSIKPSLEFLLGITYEHSIEYKQKVPTFIRFSMGYAMQYYFKKNQLIRFCDDVNDGSFFTIQGDLHMQEVNVGVACLF